MNQLHRELHPTVYLHLHNSKETIPQKLYEAQNSNKNDFFSFFEKLTSSILVIRRDPGSDLSQLKQLHNL